MRFHCRPESGFTLIELLVVMLLIGLALGLVGANFGPAAERAELRGEARKLVSVLRYTRTRALAEGESLRLVVDAEKSEYRIEPGGRARPFPDGMTMSFRPGPVVAGLTRDAIYFFPDGSSNGGSVKLASNAGTRDIRVNWLTGEVAFASR